MNEAEWTALERALAVSDPDRYVSTFFAPAARRRALVALYAFDNEVARIGAVAREPMAGHIRLAWWREQIEAVFTTAKVDVPVVRALAEALHAHRLPRGTFDAYLAARALDVEEAPFDDEAAMEAHTIATSGGIVRLAASMLGADERADDAARLAGLSCGVAGHVRDLAFFSARRRCRVPLTWLSAVGLNAEDVFGAQEPLPRLEPALDRMKGKAKRALSELNAARFPRAATAALAPATLSRWSLRRAFDPARPGAMPARQRVARLAAANFSWRF